MVYLQGIPGPDSESPQVESAQERYSRAVWKNVGSWGCLNKIGAALGML